MRRALPPKWSPAGEHTNIPNVPSILPPGIPQPLLTAILLRARYEELQHILANLESEAPTLLAYDPELSQSPVTYNSRGVRDDASQNLKRVRDSLFKERRNVISEIDSIYPVFRIPAATRIAFTKCTRKFYIDNPNMIGFILGPRGESLRALEAEFQVRISIRGKGSTVNAKNVSDRSKQSEDEPLHALIEGNTEAKIDQCVKRLEQLTTPVPDSENERKKAQLRHLAILNGVYSADVAFNEDLARTGERPPWYDETLASIQSAELDTAMEMLKQELAAPSAEKEKVSGKYDRFMIDLTTTDISALVPEPAPPGSALL